MIKDMIAGCYEQYDGSLDGSYGPGSLDSYLKLMNSSKRTIRSTFQKARAMHADLVASAIHLKIMTAFYGGYEQGGIKHYNGGGVRNYKGKVKKHMKTIKLQCGPDAFTQDVMAERCHLSGDPEACMEESFDPQDEGIDI